MSNYPPGVTGNEYEISGPEREWEQIETCSICGTEGEMVHQFHRQRGAWAFCTNVECSAYDEGFEISPEDLEESDA